jgi:dTDP-glucose 4,6-dehydratase
MSLLVTGGAGFIGSNFVLRHVVSHPQDAVVVLDKLTYAADKTYLQAAWDKITFVKGDIADTKLVLRLVKKYGVDRIVNFAAETHVDRSIKDPAPFLESNVVGVQSLIEACRTYPSILLFHISTDEVYGGLRDGDAPRRPADSLLPGSPYAASKAAADLLLQAARHTYGLRIRISRCTNNFGPHQATEKFIPTVVRCALADQPVPIYAKGLNKRDWLFVTDHCDAVEMLLERKDGDGEIFHISADAERQNIDVAKDILRILGKPESLLSHVADRPGHDWRYALDSSTVRKWGWQPRVSFEDGLRQTVEWYVQRLRK